MQLITIFTAFNSAEAQLIRARLDAAGFHPFVANENAPSYLAGFSTSSTVRVEVPEDEVAATKEFLSAPDVPEELQAM